VYSDGISYTIPSSTLTFVLHCECCLQVFQKEVMAMTQRGRDCGMWALHMVANIFDRPVVSWCPDIADESTYEAFGHQRHLMHRRIVPLSEESRNYNPLIVMWTKSTATSPTFNHFVPVFR